MIPRPKPALDDLPAAAVVRADGKGDWLTAMHRARSVGPSLSISALGGSKAPAGLCAELTEQPGRRLVHLVNYRSDGPIRDIAVTLRIPPRTDAKAVKLASPDHEADITLPFQVEETGGVTFTVPKIGVYEIAVVELSKH